MCRWLISFAFVPSCHREAEASFPNSCPLSYVDNQLRKSKRFDAEGMKKEHPEFFAPIARRRSSSSYVPAHANDNSAQANDEGQLRYWTSEMCSQNAHLFDFVVTVSTFLPHSYKVDAKAAK